MFITSFHFQTHSQSPLSQQISPLLLKVWSNLIVSPYFLIPQPTPPPSSTVVCGTCGLGFTIRGDSHREGKKRGRSHSSHFLTEGNEHILAEWKTKGRHWGDDGWLLCVCASVCACPESWDRAGTCRRGRSLLLKVLTFVLTFPDPTNTSDELSLCSWWICNDSRVHTSYYRHNMYLWTIGFRGVFLWTGPNYCLSAHECTKEQAGFGFINVAGAFFKQ